MTRAKARVRARAGESRVRDGGLSARLEDVESEARRRRERCAERYSVRRENAKETRGREGGWRTEEIGVRARADVEKRGKRLLLASKAQLRERLNGTPWGVGIHICELWRCQSHSRIFIMFYN